MWAGSHVIGKAHHLLKLDTTDAMFAGRSEATLQSLSFVRSKRCCPTSMNHRSTKAVHSTIKCLGFLANKHCLLGGWDISNIRKASQVFGHFLNADGHRFSLGRKQSEIMNLPTDLRTRRNHKIMRKCQHHLNHN
jgi:hypothetical protein